MRRFLSDVTGHFTEVRSEVPELPVRPMRAPACEVLGEEQERVRQAYVDAARRVVTYRLSRGPWQYSLPFIRFRAEAQKEVWSGSETIV